MENGKARLAMAQRVAPHLTGEWTATAWRCADGDVRGGYLTRADGLTLAVRAADWNKPQMSRVSLDVYGQVAYHSDEGQAVRSVAHGKIPSINLATTRDPKRLAKDIGRRLLPKAEETWARVRRMAQSRLDELAKRNAELAAFSRAIGLPVETTAMGEDRVHLYRGGDRETGEGYLIVDATSNGHLEIRITCDGAVGRIVGRALREAVQS